MDRAAFSLHCRLFSCFFLPSMNVDTGKHLAPIQQMTQQLVYVGHLHCKLVSFLWKGFLAKQRLLCSCWLLSDPRVEINAVLVNMCVSLHMLQLCMIHSNLMKTTVLFIILFLLLRQQCWYSPTEGGVWSTGGKENVTAESWRTQNYHTLPPGGHDE